MERGGGENGRSFNDYLKEEVEKILNLNSGQLGEKEKNEIKEALQKIIFDSSPISVSITFNEKTVDIDRQSILNTPPIIQSLFELNGINQTPASLLTTAIFNAISRYFEDSLNHQYLSLILEIFEAPPEKILNWNKLGLIERSEAWKNEIKIRTTRMIQEILEESQKLKFEESIILNGNNYDKKTGKLRLSSASVASYLIRKAVTFGLLDIYWVWFGDIGEHILKIGRRGYFEEDLKNYIYLMTNSVSHIFPPSQIYPKAIHEAKSLAKPIDRANINPPSLLNFQNLVLNLDSFETEECSDCIFTYELPPISESFLTDLKNGKITEDYFKEKPFYKILRKHYDDQNWERIKDVLGSIIAPKSLKLIAFIIGEGYTRKTVLFNLLKKSLGPLVSSIRLSSLENDRFALQAAISSRAIISSEEATTVIRNPELLKTLSGGDPLFIDRKFLPPFQLTNNIFKIIVFSNNPPSFKIWDEQLIERMVIIYTENPTEITPEESALISEAEKQTGDFLQFVLWAYKNLKEKGFNVSGKGNKEEFLEMLSSNQSSINDFIKLLRSGSIPLKSGEIKAELGEGKVEASLLYTIYQQWCSENGKPIIGRNIFYESIPVQLSDFAVVRTRTSRGTVFLNISLRTKATRSILDAVPLVEEKKEAEQKQQQAEQKEEPKETAGAQKAEEKKEPNGANLPQEPSKSIQLEEKPAERKEKEAKAEEKAKPAERIPPQILLDAMLAIYKYGECQSKESIQKIIKERFPIEGILEALLKEKMIIERGDKLCIE